MHVMEKLQNLRNLINLYIQLVLLQGFVTVHGHLNVKKKDCLSVGIALHTIRSGCSRKVSFRYKYFIQVPNPKCMDRNSSVGIATHYGLHGLGIESGGTRFSTPVQTDPGAHPASYTTGTGSFPGVKRLGRGVDHPPHLPPRLKKSRAIPLLPLWTFVDFLWWTLRYICLYLYMRVYIYIYIYIYIYAVLYVYAPLSLITWNS